MLSLALLLRLIALLLSLGAARLLLSATLLPLILISLFLTLLIFLPAFFAAAAPALRARDVGRADQHREGKRS